MDPSYIWVETQETTTRIGLSEYGLKRMKTISWIDMPQKGSKVQKEEPLLTIESSKAIMEIESPISGTVVSSHICTDELLLALHRNPQLLCLIELSSER